MHGPIGLVAPGTMGARVGGALVMNGHAVRWASEGRSERTRRRAEAAGLDDATTLEALLAEVGVLLSVCPPGAALPLAREVAAQGFAGIYVDANAVAPPTAVAIEEAVRGARATYVDGGIIGPPPVEAGTTRLYLAGAAAADVAGLFTVGPLDAVALDVASPGASALKMCYAAWTKGSAALLLAVCALAAAEDVGEALAGEWAQSQPGLAERAQASAARNAPKAWRFTDEMAEIAQTFAGAGLPDGFHRAAGEVYQRLADFKDAQDGIPVDTVVGRLLDARK